MDGSVTGTNGQSKESEAKNNANSTSVRKMTETKVPATESDSNNGDGSVNHSSFPSTTTQISSSSGRSRRKAPPKKVILDEEFYENSLKISDGMSEPQSSLPTHTATGHTTTSDTSSEATPEVTSEELLLRLQTALGGNIDVQQLLAQMINTGPLGMPPFTSFVQPKTETDEHLLAVLQNQIANTAAQQQILALTSAVPFNPSTPIETSFTASTSKLTHSESPSTSTRPASQPQRAQKRKLFESVQGSSTGGSGASSSSGTLRGSSLEGMSRDERIEIEDLEQFAALFKKQRIKFGFTQGDVGQALGKRYGTDFSQTTISRFEAMNLSFKNMCKLRPLLKEWLTDAERAIANGASVSELIDPVPSPSSNLPLSSLQVSNQTQISPKTNLSSNSIDLCWSSESDSEQITHEFPHNPLHKSLSKSLSQISCSAFRTNPVNLPALVKRLDFSPLLHSSPLPEKFRRSPIGYDLHLERDLLYQNLTRKNPFVDLRRFWKILKAKRCFKSPKLKDSRVLDEEMDTSERSRIADSLKYIFSTAYTGRSHEAGGLEEVQELEETINESTSQIEANERHTASRIVDLMEEDPPTNPIPGDHSLLVTNDPIDEDPDLYEWTNHLWNGQERPSNSERGNDWRTFWNHNSWNGTDFNAGLRWRGRGGEWEMRGCGEGMDEYRVQEWPTTASGAIGWEMVDTTVDLFGDLAVFDDD